jgi:hypothetical protein
MAWIFRRDPEGREDVTQLRPLSTEEQLGLGPHGVRYFLTRRLAPVRDVLPAAASEELAHLAPVVHGVNATARVRLQGGAASTWVGRHSLIRPRAGFLNGTDNRGVESMRAAIFRGPGTVEVGERPDPVIQAPTDAIVRVVLACVCGSDLWYYRGTSPHAVGSIGHEFVGVVEETGADVTTVAWRSCR